MRFLQIEKKLCKKIEKTFKYVLTSWIPYDIILIVELRNRQKSNKCECAGIGRQARLRGVCFTTYGFKSRHSHHRKDLIPCVSSLFYFMQASDDGTWRRPLRKQSGGLFLGRALMKVWLWTSRIGEDGSLTNSNHRHSHHKKQLTHLCWLLFILPSSGVTGLVFYHIIFL